MGLGIVKKTRQVSGLVFTLLFTVALFVTINSQETAHAIGSGSGSTDDPYQISTCAHLSDINNSLDAVYELTADISCSGMDPGRIGSETAPFTGEFRGNGYTISDITVVTNDDDMGLFGRTSEATIYNVVLDNIYFGGVDNVGALVGHTYYTTIQYVFVKNSNITGSGQHTGGIVGYLGGSTLTRSSAEDTIVEGNSLVGGLAGIAIGPSAISFSYVQGTVNGSTGVGGITGQAGAGPAIVQDTYMDVIFGDAGSGLVGSVQSGASVIGGFTASAPYLSNDTESPLDSWDFDTVWEVRDGDYPGLRVFPQMLCEAPTSTENTIHAICETEPALLGDATWEIQYAFADSSNWTSLPDQSGVGFNATASNVLPGTEYRVRFRFNWEGLTSAWGSQEILTAGDSDVDGDGISNQEESLAPNNGDADDDGTADYQQANVTSFESFISGNYIVLKTSCGDNYNVQLGLESSSQADSDFDYSTGLLSFVARGCGIGSTETVDIYFYGDYSTDLILRKSRGAIYSTIPGTTITSTTIGGSQAVVANYQIKDGGELDDDGVADGNIVDPVGLASSSSELADTGSSQNLLVFISVVMLSAGMLASVKSKSVHSNTD